MRYVYNADLDDVPEPYIKEDFLQCLNTKFSFANLLPSRLVHNACILQNAFFCLSLNFYFISFASPSLLNSLIFFKSCF